MKPQQRFSYVKYDDKATKLQIVFKGGFEQLTAVVDAHLPDGRAKALVHTKLEEAYMWVGKAIRDEQIARTGKIDEQPERTDG